METAAAGVRPGDIIVTSGLGGQFPKGLPVGKVVEVGGSNHDLFPTVYVEPLVSLRSLENVLILTSYRTDGVPAYGSASAAADATPTATPTSVAGSSERRPAESVLPGGAR